MEKIICENPGEKKLSDALDKKNVSDVTLRLLGTFMGEIDRRLISKTQYVRVKTHQRGLTYFPSPSNQAKAFWVNFSRDWFTIAYTEGGREFSKRVAYENLDEMLDFAEDLFLTSISKGTGLQMPDEWLDR